MATQRTNEQFFRYFQNEVAELQEQIDRIATHSVSGGEGTDAVEHCSASIARLSNEVREQLDTLPAHDKQTYSDAIKALSAKLHTARGQVTRKQKFSFKSSTFKIPKNASAVSLHDAAELASQRRLDGGNAPDISQLSDSSTTNEALSGSASSGNGILQRQNEYIRVSQGEPQLALLVEVCRSVADLTDTRAYPNFRLRNIAHSIIILPDVTGPIYLENISHSILLAGCHQFRMHNSSNCEVYLYCSSRPIIEDCSDIQFAPMPAAYAKGRSDNKWNQIDDFKWLRAEQSPHWSIIPEAQRRTEDFWGEIETIRKSDDIGGAIKALGLP